MDKKFNRLFQKLKMGQLVNRALITVVGILLCFLLLIVCLTCTTGSVKTTIRMLTDDMISDGGVFLVQSNSNVLKFLGDNSYYDSEQMLESMYPMKRHLSVSKRADLITYVASEKDEQTSDIINKKKPVMIEDEDEFLFYNGSTENEDIIDAEKLDVTINHATSDPNLIFGETYLEDESTSAVEVMTPSIKKKYLALDQLKDYNMLINNCFIVDPSTAASESIFNISKFMEKDMTMKPSEGKPQILIYHTHSQETFADSRKGHVEDSVVGVGAYLADILESEYGIEVIHDTTTYDIVDGSLDRNLAYSVAGPSIEKILEYNKDIELVIDLHRDGVNRAAGKRLTTIDGENCAQIMFFNGLCYNSTGPITTLANPYIEDNLALSFQLFYQANQRFDDLCTRTYLKAYRYNMHLCPKSVLIELGTQYNTVGEAKNSMKYFAAVLNDVLTGKNK